MSYNSGSNRAPLGPITITNHKRLNYKSLSFCCMLHPFILLQTILIESPLAMWYTFAYVLHFVYLVLFMDIATIVSIPTKRRNLTPIRPASWFQRPLSLYDEQEMVVNSDVFFSGFSACIGLCICLLRYDGGRVRYTQRTCYLTWTFRCLLWLILYLNEWVTSNRIPVVVGTKD